jgi:phosphoribosylamine--glycine ligase
MKILVTGKGGREHALITALSESPQKHELFAYPGSDAIEALATRVDVAGLPELIDLDDAERHRPLCGGRGGVAGEGSRTFQSVRRGGIPCWGPLKEIAQLEASKTFAKKFLQRHGIPTADFTICTNAAEAKAALTETPIVLKFDGLAAGKGVAVCTRQDGGGSFRR